MTQLDSVIKPKTKRSKRFLESRAPKLTEDVKSAMIMKGGNTSQTITQALKDIVTIPNDLVCFCTEKVLVNQNALLQTT
uniref:Uncharacterized protein n=1 Tax=Oreochromis aureus TaxID=47969 RepID=A0AAZ1XQY1_OREAU